MKINIRKSCGSFLLKYDNNEIEIKNIKVFDTSISDIVNGNVKVDKSNKTDIDSSFVSFITLRDSKRNSEDNKYIFCEETNTLYIEKSEFDFDFISTMISNDKLINTIYHKELLNVTLEFTTNLF